jgi:glycosyltransferase involved in cell wall biosynthesis
MLISAYDDIINLTSRISNEKQPSLKMMQPTITIIIPQYKTYQVTQLCLRALKKFSTLNVEIIVVDNNSADDSLEYLEKNKWIQLIKNKNASIGGAGHKQALDIGIKAAKSDWILLFHSDTIVLKKAWDEDLLNLVKKYPDAVGASSIVRDINPFSSWHSKLIRKFKDRQHSYHHTLNTSNNKIMSYCFLVKRKFLIDSGFNFEHAEGDVADAFYRNHIKGKYPFVLMGRSFLQRILWHTSNVSSILTGQMTDTKAVHKLHKKLNSLFSSTVIESLMNDSSLDNF